MHEMAGKYRYAVVVLAAALLALPASAVSGKTMYNYIAYGPAFWPKDKPATADQFQKELGYLAGIKFDTLVFAPMFGFGSMAAILNSATYPKHQPLSDSRWMRNWRNAMPELVKAGVDPVAETVKWCRTNKREAVAALPVNLLGTHSSKPESGKSLSSWHCYLWPDFKAQNSDALMNPDGKAKLVAGYGICVNYAQAKVRDKFAAIACEMAGKYDLDGIMVDFTQLPALFKSVAEGGTASTKEAELITEMMGKIKAACKAASGRLGHPVALSARVPDSIGYCRDIGIDLQNWLDTKLLDYVVLGGYFQLNRWNVVGDVAKKAGVPFYAAFTQSGIHVGNDSGYTGDDERLPRHSRAACRARMADAMLCGAAGCMYSMGMHFEVQFPNSIVVPFDPKENRTADKRYFISYTNDRAAGNTLKEWTKHRTVQSLLSGSPVDLAKGVAKYRIDVWDDFAALEKDGFKPKATLVTEVSIPSGVDTVVTFNGRDVKPFKKRAGTQLYEIPSALMKVGGNEVTIKSKGKNRRGLTAKLGNIAVEVTFSKPEAKKEAGK